MDLAIILPAGFEQIVRLLIRIGNLPLYSIFIYPPLLVYKSCTLTQQINARPAAHVAFSDQMMDVLLEQKIRDPLLTQLPSKPILVAVSRSLMYSDSAGSPGKAGYNDIRPKATAADNVQVAFIKNKVLDDVDFYEGRSNSFLVL